MTAVDAPRKRRRWPWVTAAILGALVIAAGTATAAIQFGLPWWMQQGDSHHMHDSDAGSVRFQVHLPH